MRPPTEPESPGAAGGPPGGRHDAALLAAHVDGDPDAFGELVRRHSDRLWAVALRTVGDPEEAADAVQDALLSAYRSASAFRGDAAVSTWLHRIVVNACLDRLRRRRPRDWLPLPEGGPGEPVQPGDPIGDRDTALAVRGALAAIPADQRAAVVLVDIAGHPVRAAAVILGVAEGTVKSRCARGRARLAVLLGHLRNPDPTTDVRPSDGDAARLRKGDETVTEPDLDLLADYAAGLLDDTARAIVAARIDDDPRWARRYAELVAADSAVRAELAALPPVTMPTEVRHRLHAALAAESGGAVRPGQDQSHGGTVVPLRRRRWLTASAGVAAGVAVLATGLIGVATLTGDPAVPARDRGESSAMGSAESSGPVTATGADYDPGRLPGQVRTLLAAVAASDVKGQQLPGQATDEDRPSATVPAGLARFSEPGAVEACVAAVTGAGPGTGGAAPLAVDLARYEGTPAVVVVLPGPDPSVVTVVVAGPACGASGADERQRTTVPR